MSDPILAYRVCNWATLYENNRTKELKNLTWLPLPNRHDGDGYTLLVDRENGAALFGAWVVFLQVASKCEVRGTLLRDASTPHDSASLSRITRIPKKIIESMLDVCVNECKWVEIIDMQTGAVMSHEGAVMSHLARARIQEGNGREWKGMEGNGSDQKPPADSSKALEEKQEKYVNARVALHYLNEKASRAFRETSDNLQLIKARLSEVDDDIEGVKRMIDRQVAKWKTDPKMNEYLCPGTLFRKSNFSKYYDMRDVPLTHQSRLEPPDENLTPAQRQTRALLASTH